MNTEQKAQLLKNAILWNNATHAIETVKNECLLAVLGNEYEVFPSDEKHLDALFSSLKDAAAIANCISESFSRYLEETQKNADEGKEHAESKND